MTIRSLIKRLRRNSSIRRVAACEPPARNERNPCENCPSFRQGKQKVMAPTLTQSGLLAVLLQRQRCKVIQLARRRAHRKHMRAAVWNTFTWPRRALTAPTSVDDSAKLLVGTVPRHT